MSTPAEGPEGLSIVTVVMNRLPHLKITAPRISRCQAHREHLILDWSSDPPIQREHLPQDPRIRLLRVEGEPRWCLTRAYNFAIEMAQGPLILKLDADCWLTEGEEGSPWWTLEPGTYQRSATGGGLNGIVMIRREDFLASGGFHEGLQGYGHDDKDLYARLASSLECRFLPAGQLHTLEHGDQERVAGQRGLKGLGGVSPGRGVRRKGASRLGGLEAIARMEESKATNRRLAEAWPWSSSEPKTRYVPLGRDCWSAEVPSLPAGDPALVAEARALGTRVYLALLLGLPERFLDQQIPSHQLEQVRSWTRFLRLQAWLRLLVLLPLLRQGLRLHSAWSRVWSRLGQRLGDLDAGPPRHEASP